MSRVIKFRAWDPIKKQMLFAEEFPIYHELDNGLHSGKLNEDGDWYSLELMQYTGLKDLNGVDIFEGDIVESDYYAPAVIERTAVAYQIDGNIGQFGFDAGLPDSFRYGDLRVIGSIHEHSHLLD